MTSTRVYNIVLNNLIKKYKNKNTTYVDYNCSALLRFLLPLVVRDD